VEVDKVDIVNIVEVDKVDIVDIVEVDKVVDRIEEDDVVQYIVGIQVYKVWVEADGILGSLKRRQLRECQALYADAFRWWFHRTNSYGVESIEKIIITNLDLFF